VLDIEGFVLLHASRGIFARSHALEPLHLAFLTENFRFRPCEISEFKPVAHVTKQRADRGRWEEMTL
jgi:hypothetical protein